jgi:hypothetical protein
MNAKHLLPLRLRSRIADWRGRGVYSGYADRCKCIFIHIPKTAGTSVAQSLFGQPSRHVTWHEYEAANPGKFRRYFKFAFVRNPWDRLASTYFFLRKGGLNAVDAQWAERTLGAYPDFGAFVRGWVDERNIASWVHFRAQHEFICAPDGKVMVDFVGRVESMDADFAHVAQRLGRTSELAKLNVGERRHYSTCYDDKTREIVARVYARDIDLFGYKFEPEGP